MAQKFLLFALLLVFSITAGMLLGSIDRDVIVAKKKKPVAAATAPKPKKLTPNQLLVKHLQRPEVKGRVELGPSDKPGVDLVLILEGGKVRFCEEEEVSKECAVEMKLDGTITKGEKKEIEIFNLARDRILFPEKFQNRAHTALYLLGR